MQPTVQDLEGEIFLFDYSNNLSEETSVLVAYRVNGGVLKEECHGDDRANLGIYNTEDDQRVIDYLLENNVNQVYTIGQYQTSESPKKFLGRTLWHRNLKSEDGIRDYWEFYVCAGLDPEKSEQVKQAGIEVVVLDHLENYITES